MRDYVSIRTRVLVPLTLTFLVLFCSFLYSSFAIQRENINSTMNREYGETLALFKELLYYRVEWMTTAAETVLHDPALQTNMHNGNRAALYHHALPYFQKLHKNGVSHFYFHDRKGRVFLRVHQPDRYGDTITRESLQRSMKFGNAAYGMELGPYGTLTLRLVLPWHAHGTMLGYVELGTEINDTLSDLAIINNVDYVVTLNKKLLNKDAVDDSSHWLNRKLDWDFLPNTLVFATSLTHIPANLKKYLTFSQTNQKLKDSWQVTSFNSKQFAFKLFPFYESNGRQVGTFILLYDVTQQTKKFKLFIIQIIGFSSLVCSILFGFTWRILGHVDNTICKNQDKLEREISKTAEANHLLEIEIAERQKAEEALVQLNNQLESKIAERINHLERARQEIEKHRDELESASAELRSRQAMILHQDKMASIGLLAAGVAHDINNPIGFVANNLEELREYLTKLKTFIRNQRELLKQGASPELLAALQKNSDSQGIHQIFEDFDTLIAESLEGTTRVSDIVKNLRNFSRVDDADYLLADVNECLEGAIKITQHELRTKALVQRDFGAIPKIYCCPQQLNQAFMNLLVNAAHAIETSGEVNVRSWADTSWVYVTISDTGCGIPDEMLSKIFEPFFTTKEINKGTGLGLNIVSDIITQHRGEIHVTSQPDHGTTFTIKLPIITGAAND